MGGGVLFLRLENHVESSIEAPYTYTSALWEGEFYF
jgi:hypothetical protein